MTDPKRDSSPDTSGVVPTALTGFLFFGVMMALISVFASAEPSYVSRIPNAIVVGLLYGLFGALAGAVVGAFGAEGPQRPATDP